MNRNNSQSEEKHAGLLRLIFLLLGLLCLGAGLVGAFLPILPTTPFLILAVFFFTRSSGRLNLWLQSTRFYQSHLAGIKRKEGITLPAKLRILATVTLLMGLASFFMLRAYLIKGKVFALVGVIVMGLVWLGHVIAFLWMIPTCPTDADHAAGAAGEDSGREERGQIREINFSQEGESV